jgi:hypothetical protein
MHINIKSHKNGTMFLSVFIYEIKQKGYEVVTAIELLNLK